ncbi:MAG TPA: 1-acyl-sn-glycerol-3-phosphate acyltransferase [Thermoleophilaceae bacterium]|nr:1-acyl-sn-glycerol-3-phosphate acyltransferase [Thermoleophilaceae bacterium]
MTATIDKRPTDAPAEDRDGHLERYHERTRRRGVNHALLLLVNLTLRPLLLVFFRLGRIGREHIPKRGGVLLAANHRSFLDPFVIGVCTLRPCYFMAKRELFDKRWMAWVLNRLGAFPVCRGESDEEAMTTARILLERGAAVVVFPEGTRIRRGSLERPRRGVGRLALETGSPVVPIAVLGSERARRGWRIRPVKVRVRCGRPLTFPHVERPTERLAAELSERIWPCVELQWEWLGGLPPLRTAAVVGAGSMGTALAVLLVRAGLETQLACRHSDQAARLRDDGRNADYLPDVDLPDGLRMTTTSEIEFGAIDLVVIATPSRDLPQVMGQIGARIGARSAVLVLSKGLVAPLATRPTDYVAARCPARAAAHLGGPAHAAEAVASGAAVVLASDDDDLRHQLAPVLERAGLEVEATDDVAGAEFGGVAKNAATLAASVAAEVGMNAAGAAAGRVFAEVHELARALGSRPDTLAGLAGVGDLIGTALADGSRNRRAGELLAGGVPAEQVPALLGCAAEALDTIPLVVAAAEGARVPCPATRGLAALIAGETAPEHWIEALLDRTAEGRRRAALAEAG